MKFGDLRTHGGAQLGIQVGERLVEEEHFGIADDRAAQRNSLTLTARHRLWFPVKIIDDAQDLGCRHHLLSDLLLCVVAHDPDELPLAVEHGVAVAIALDVGRLVQLQSERHIVEHRHVRIERIFLEYHGNIAVLRLYIVDDPAVDRKNACRDLFKPRDHAKRRRLPAARRPDKDDKFLIVDLHREIIDCFCTV